MIVKLDRLLLDLRLVVKRFAVLLIVLVACDEDEPYNDYRKLIVGKWVETRAVELSTDFQDPRRSSETDLTNELYALEFLDARFALSLAGNRADSGQYDISYVESMGYLNTRSVDNIRVPKLMGFPTQNSRYEILDLTKDRLVLRCLVSQAEDYHTGTPVFKREFLWELRRQQ